MGYHSGHGPLEGYRVLDLTNENGYLLGRLFADMGADVVKVEPPGGDPGRSRGPFHQDRLDKNRSLYWFAYNLGKRSITLSLETADGRYLLGELARKASFVVESFQPGYLDGLGIGFRTLAEINPRTILVSLTGFGQDGPWRDFQAPDLVVSALGGYQWLLGEPDRAPVRVGYPMVYPVACAWALAGAMIAHYRRQLTGQGQHVDCSAQESQCWFLNDSHLFWELCGLRQRRAGWGRIRPTTGFYIPEVVPCKDGSVSFFVIGGTHGGGTMRALVQWMEEEGAANDYLRNMDWDSFDYGSVTAEILENTMDPILAFFKTRTRAELYEQALKRRIMLYPAQTVDGLMEDRQLKARNFWVEVEHPELDLKLRYPGPWALMTGSPLRTGQRAPLVGEHNSEVYAAELGLSRKQMATLKEAGVI